MVDKQLKIDNENELNDMPPTVSSLSLTLGASAFQSPIGIIVYK